MIREQLLLFDAATCAVLRMLLPYLLPCYCQYPLPHLSHHHRVLQQSQQHVNYSRRMVEELRQRLNKRPYLHYKKPFCTLLGLDTAHEGGGREGESVEL